MIDIKQSFRKGSVIVEVHVGVTESEIGVKFQNITKVPTDYGSINKAKKANRVTQYRTIPTGLRKKVNGVWVRS